MAITNKDYTKKAQRVLKETFGFAPALKDIVLLECGENNKIITMITFAVSKKGYCWSLGHEVERCKLYDI